MASLQESKNYKKGRQVTQRGRLVNAAADPIRAELNIEKWPALWRPAHSRKGSVVRVLEREHTLKDGSRLRARVEVGFSHLGGLTTEDQRTYYALVKQWSANGQSVQPTFLTIRSLARTLRKRWGTNVIASITDSLRRLRATPVSWMNSYFDSGHHEILEEIETFNILADLKLVRRKVDGRITREAGYFQFNDFTLNNLLANHTKPVLFETILGFRGELAQLLYTHLDLILADKYIYERKSKELFSDLGLSGTEYQLTYERKRALKTALSELNGVLLTTGVISSISIEPTRDGSDCKLRVVKSATISAPDPATERGVVTPQIREVGPAAREAERIVKHFHKHFHSVDRAYPQSKELSQATALIAQHGFDRAKYVVDYAHIAAAKTNYLPQTFGGILQYEARAVSTFDKSLLREQAIAHERATREARETFELLEAQITEKKRHEAEVRLASLPPAEYDAFYTRSKAVVMKRDRWVGEDEEAGKFKYMVRLAMIDELMSMANDSNDKAA